MKMSKKKPPQHRPARIIDLDPTLREIDGVVFDADSYEKHYIPVSPLPQSATDSTDEKTPETAGVFLCDPVHIGWHQNEDGTQYPIMGGMVCLPCSSGSFLSSYLTTALSFSHSFGSFGSFGSFSTTSAIFCGGYGLELI